MPEIIIYSKENCPYCVMANNLLIQKGIKNIKKIQIDLDDKARDEMIKITNRRTVPQIFINNTHIGGYDDLKALETNGKLDLLLMK